MQLIHRLGQSGGPGGGQLPGCAVAVDGPDAGQTVLFGTQHIMLAVADHDKAGLVGDARSFQCVGNDLGGPGSCVIISVKDSDKAEAAELAWKLHDYGYKIYGTPGTARFLNSEMVPCSVVRQMSGARPNVIDLLESGLVDYIISTSPHGRDPHRDSVKFRRKATELSIPTITAMDTARVLVDALRGDHDISQMELVDIANLHREAAKGE